MTTIHVSTKIAEKLNQLAEREHKSVDEVLEAILEHQTSPLNADKPRPGSGAALLKSALEADIHAGDLAGKSREILEKEFPDYLRKRIEGSDSES